MRSIISLMVFVFFLSAHSLSASAQAVALGSAISAGLKTKPVSPSKAAVAEALISFRNARNSVCVGLLSTFTGGLFGKDLGNNMNDIVGKAPSWLVDTAQAVFVDNQSLDPDQLNHIKNYRFPTDISVSGSSKRVVKAAFFELTPLEAQMSPPPQDVSISKFSVKQSPGKNFFSVRIRMKYQSGQEQDLYIENAPLRMMSSEQALAQMVLAVHRHRAVLESEDALRREINALRFNLLKLVRVVRPQQQADVNRLIQSLGNLSAQGMFTRDRTHMGLLFLTYLNAKHDVIQLSQTVQRLQSKAPQASNAAPTTGPTQNRPQLVQRGPNVTPYFRSSRPRVIYQSQQSDSYLLSTWGWYSDPYFMLTHPWYWGTRDNSLLAPLMMFELLTDPTRYSAPQPLFVSPDPYTMDNFNEPVVPTYTNDPYQPVVNPWDAQPDPSLIIEPQFDGQGPVQWNDTNGTPVIIVDPATEGQGWGDLTGEPETQAPPPSEAAPVSGDQADPTSPATGPLEDDGQSPEVVVTPIAPTAEEQPPAVPTVDEPQNGNGNDNTDDGGRDSTIQSS